MGLGSMFAFGLCWCGSAQQQLPRIERYDFEGETPADLARLRQMVPAEGEEGPMARYALARAHADWLVLGLIRDRDDDMLLRRLAMDLGVEGASPDDRLGLTQVVATIDAILAEVRAANAAGGEARAWSGEMVRLLEAVRDGWEEFSPTLIRALAEISAEEGPARNAADLLALGWGRLALWAAEQQPPAEQADLLARMAGYFDPDVVDALHRGRESLLAAGVEVGCPALGRDIDLGSNLERLARARAGCDATSLGLPSEAGEMLSAELVVTVRVLRDLAARRERLGAVTDDPLVTAATGDLDRFDQQMASVRFHLPLPAPGPNLPAPPLVQGPGSWQPAGAVISAHENRLRIGLWPTLALREGQLRLIDRVDALGLPGRPAAEELPETLRRTWQVAGERLGIQERSVALLLPADLDVRRLIWILQACFEAEASRIDLVVTTSDESLATIPLNLDRGAAAMRTIADHRALMVLGPESLRIGFAEGQWRELNIDGEDLPVAEIAPLLGQHIAGLGNPTCLVAVRPGCSLGQVAQLVDLLAHAPRTMGGTSTGWTVSLDPEDAPGPARVAATPADAVSRHHVRLRGCYERYMRTGGTAQGRLVLVITVAAGGSVSDARVVDSELGSQPNLDACLVSEARQIRFPPDVTPPTVRIPLRCVPR
jgi:hypothetical protein